MTLVIPVGYGEILHSLAYSGDPQPMAVTYGVAAPGGPFTLQDMVDDCATAFVTNVLPELSDVVSLVQTELKFRTTALPAPLDLAVSTNTGTGGEGAAATPQNCAYLCHKRGSVAGRGGRGRFYLPGLLESDVDHVGTVASGKVTSLNTALSGFLADLTGGANVDGMVVLHQDPGAYSADAPAPVTVLTVDAKIATQRRRLRP